MGQKVNPRIFRTGVITVWSAKWYADADYAKHLEEDIKIRKFFKQKLRDAGLAKVEITRSPGKIEIKLYSAKPGLIIGKGGSKIDELKKEILRKIIFDKKVNLEISIHEVDRPNLSAEIMVQNIALEIEKRVPYLRVMKRAIDAIRKAGAQGVKVQVSGRLNGAEIARIETLSEGKIPLHTLRANIDYARGAAITTYGTIGIKVWIYKGEVFEENNK